MNFFRNVLVLLACYLVGKLVSDTFISGWIAYMAGITILLIVEEAYD